MTERRSKGVAERILRRSSTDQILGGVCGGLGPYLGVDPVVVRFAFVILAVAGGGGILLYLIAWLIIPAETEGEPVGPPPERRMEGLWMWIGVALIALGSILLVDYMVPWFDRVIGPLVLVAIGVGIVLYGVRREPPSPPPSPPPRRTSPRKRTSEP